jgi:flagellar motor switch protein FliN
MSAAETSELAPRVAEYFDLWGQLIAAGLTRIRNEEMTLAPVAAGAGESSEGLALPEGVWTRLFGGKAGEQAFFLEAADALRLAQWLSASTESETLLAPEARDAIVQFFQQIATTIPMKDWVGAECELEASEIQIPAWASTAESAYRVTAPEGASIVVHARLSHDFEMAIQPAKGQPELAPPPPPPIPPAFARAAKPRDGNLDLLMDVELEATLRFGSREMLLGDVLNLVPGSVLELDQQVQDPVELLIGNKVIAWGEVVTVDGNYGLRVTALASAEERLESLRK